MPKRSYWLDLFTGTTWREFIEHGATVSGFRESRRTTVHRIRLGDYLLCYVTGISRWIGAIEVTGPPFDDTTPIWKDKDFPSRLPVKTVVALDFDTAIPVVSMRDQLSFFKNLRNPNAWTGHFRGSPNKIRVEDGEAIITALFEAKANPVPRPYDKDKLTRVPRIFQPKDGPPVTVPDTDHLESGPEPTDLETAPQPHTEMQYLLLKLGSEMGLEVWAARNDRNREYNGAAIASIPRMKSSLPLQFDAATMKTIELIDVLWLQGNAIAAAFEVENTSLIYSGLLRLSDLITMQPNISMPLFIVAPEERRDKVISEINRPTFSRLKPPMSEMCRYIPFGALRTRLSEVAALVKYLKLDFLDELSESCAIDDV